MKKDKKKKQLQEEPLPKKTKGRIKKNIKGAADILKDLFK